MKKRIFPLALILLMLAAVIPLTGCGESTDYIASVKALKPFDDYGISVTYGTVLNKYISSATWKERTQSKELTYVDVTGKLKGIDGNTVDVAITFKVTPYEGATKGMLWITPHLTEIEGLQPFDSDDTAEFIEELFDAYEEGFESYFEYYDYYYN